MGGKGGGCSQGEAREGMGPSYVSEGSLARLGSGVQTQQAPDPSRPQWLSGMGLA